MDNKFSHILFINVLKAFNTVIHPTGLLVKNLDTGELVLIQWKMANVTVIPKVNPQKSIECDLHPISLISTISKLLEAKIGN